MSYVVLAGTGFDGFDRSYPPTTAPGVGSGSGAYHQLDHEIASLIVGQAPVGERLPGLETHRVPDGRGSDRLPRVVIGPAAGERLEELRHPVRVRLVAPNVGEERHVSQDRAERSGVRPVGAVQLVQTVAKPFRWIADLSAMARPPGSA